MKFTNSVKVFAVRGIIQSAGHIYRKFWELIVFFSLFLFSGLFYYLSADNFFFFNVAHSTDRSLRTTIHIKAKGTGEIIQSAE